MIVGAAPLVVTASSCRPPTGPNRRPSAPSYSGFLNGDTAAWLTTQPTCDAATTHQPGRHLRHVVCSGATDPNYSITYVDGSVTVAPAPVMVTASSAYMVYGATVPAVTPSVDGLQNGEGASVLGAGLRARPPRPRSSSVGSYPTSARARPTRTTRSPTSTARSTSPRRLHHDRLVRVDDLRRQPCPRSPPPWPGCRTARTPRSSVRPHLLDARHRDQAGRYVHSHRARADPMPTTPSSTSTARHRSPRRR